MSDFWLKTLLKWNRFDFFDKFLQFYFSQDFLTMCDNEVKAQIISRIVHVLWRE